METEAFEEHLLCPICREIFTDPVLLLCSHSFCLGCLEQYWVHSSSQKCPECRTEFFMECPPCNRALKNLCEVILEEKEKQALSADVQESLCSLHGERLELFCLEDRRLLCGVCMKADLHIGHTCKPVDEMAETLKEDLQTILKSLQEKFKLLKSQKFFCNQRAKHIKIQAEETEACIKEEFERLHQFLKDEEGIRIASLKDEEEQKIKILDDQILKINSELSSLLERIKTTEDEINTQNISFLLNYRGPRESIQSSGSWVQSPSEEVFNTAKHLGNLQFSVWQKMTDIIQYTPVVLDPNTAHPYLHVSDSLTDVTFGQWTHLWTDGYSETYDGYTSVLGSEGFSSGSHYWDVEVGDNTTWALGTISESAVRMRNCPPCSGLWRIAYHKGKYGQGDSGEVLTPLTVKQKIQRIRVCLNWDSGDLSFFNVLTNTRIHTFKHTFTERVFPYFCNMCPTHALRILPVQASVGEQNV